MLVGYLDEAGLLGHIIEMQESSPDLRKELEESNAFLAYVKLTSPELCAQTNAHSYRRGAGAGLTAAPFLGPRAVIPASCRQRNGMASR